MAILEVVGDDCGYLISFTCPQNRDEDGIQGTNRKVVLLLEHLFEITYVIYLSLAQRIGISIQGTPNRVLRGNFDHWNVCTKRHANNVKFSMTLLFALKHS